MLFEVEGRVKENTKKSHSRNFGIYVHSLHSVYKIRVFTNNSGELLLIKSAISRLMTVLFVGKSMNLVLSGWRESLFS